MPCELLKKRQAWCPTKQAKRASGQTDLEGRQIFTQFGEYNIICSLLAGGVLMQFAMRLICSYCETFLHKHVHQWVNGVSKQLLTDNKVLTLSSMLAGGVLMRIVMNMFYYCFVKFYARTRA